MRESDYVKILNDLLAINTVNGEADEGEAARYLHRLFEECGITSELQYIDESHTNVIAEVRGSDSEWIIWNGHMDTVPYGDAQQWYTDPAVPEEHGGRIYARGASDMKSGLAGMACALIEIKRSGRIPAQGIRFIGTCDEEKGGLGAAKIRQAGHMEGASLILIGEPTCMKPASAQKGCLWVELTVRGRTSHGAYPEEGMNALTHGFSALTEFGQWIEKHSHPLAGAATAQVTMARGGIVPNMTPDHAVFLMDVRTVPDMRKEEVLGELNRICIRYESLHDQLQLTYRLMNERRAIETPVEHPYIRRFQEALRGRNREDTVSGISYFTDASVLTDEGQDLSVIFMGPGRDYLAHKPNEWVELQDYLDYTELLIEIFGRESV